MGRVSGSPSTLAETSSCSSGRDQTHRRAASNAVYGGQQRHSVEWLRDGRMFDAEGDVEKGRGDCGGRQT